MRRSEIAELKWDAVDLEGSWLGVAATLLQIRGHGLLPGTPKTQKSCRPIEVGAMTVELLRVVHGDQTWSIEETGPLWENNGYVFTQADGSPVLPNSLVQDFALLVEELKPPHLTFHGLRHAFATLALLSGESPNVVSEALGHSRVTITLDTYSHVLPNMQDEMMTAGANILKR